MGVRRVSVLLSELAYKIHVSLRGKPPRGARQLTSNLDVLLDGGLFHEGGGYRVGWSFDVATEPNRPSPHVRCGVLNRHEPIGFAHRLHRVESPQGIQCPRGISLQEFFQARQDLFGPMVADEANRFMPDPFVLARHGFEP